MFIENIEQLVDKSKLLLHSKIQLSKSGIVEIDVFDNVIINKDCSKEIIAGFKKMLDEGKKYPILCVVGSGVDIEKEARKYGVTPEGTMFSKAEAYIVKSLVKRLMSNTLLQIRGSKANLPTKFFNDRNEARAWLLKFV